MNKERKLAREYLNDAPLKSFWNIVNEAKIGDDDQVVLDLRFVHDWSIGKIAQSTNYSPEQVNAIIKRCYDKVARALEVKDDA